MKAEWQEIKKQKGLGQENRTLNPPERGFYSADYWEPSKDYKQESSMLGLCFR